MRRENNQPKTLPQTRGKQNKEAGMFAIIEATGTHLQIGETIGESLRPKIKESLNLHLTGLTKRRDANFDQNLQLLTNTVKKHFPRFLDELRGIARGANEPLERLLIFSFEEELSAGHEACTTVAIKSEKIIFFAHNEDWDLPLPLCLVKGKPKGQPAFLALSYAGQFPGTAVGMNERGIIYAGNSIATRFNSNGTPKTYCLRSFLEMKNLAEINQFINRQQMALGNSSVIVSGHEKKIMTAEWSPEKYFIENMDARALHTNHFLSKAMLEFQTLPMTSPRLKSSRLRMERIAALTKNLAEPTFEEMKKIMRDHARYPFSVCRHQAAGKTLASVIVDAKEQKMYIAAGSPCVNEYRAYSL